MRIKGEFEPQPNDSARWPLAKALTESPLITAIVGQGPHVVQPIREGQETTTTSSSARGTWSPTRAPMRACPTSARTGWSSLLDCVADGRRGAGRRTVSYVPVFVDHPDYEVLPIGDALSEGRGGPEPLLRASYRAHRERCRARAGASSRCPQAAARRRRSRHRPGATRRLRSPRGAAAEAPVEPQLALSRKTLPEGDEWAYEPKWDGFRALAFVDGDEVFLQSRNGRPLRRYFPEVDFPSGSYVLDGELVILGEDGHEQFDALQNRLHPAESRVRMLAEKTPARSTPSTCSPRVTRRCFRAAVGAPRAAGEARRLLGGRKKRAAGSIELTDLTNAPRRRSRGSRAARA